MTTGCIAARKSHELFLKYQPLVHRIAGSVRRRVPKHISMDDLKSAGYLGLVQALRRWDETRSAEAFEAMAALRIRGAILDDLRSHDRLTRRDRRAVKRMQRARQTLTNTLGREVEDQELAAQTGLDPETLQRLREVQRGAEWTHLDEPAIKSQLRTNTDIASLCDARSAAHLIARLPTRLREVIRLRFLEDLNMREIGERLGVSESRVCQLQTEALAKLRSELSDPPSARQRKAPKLHAAKNDAMQSV